MADDGKVGPLPGSELTWQEWLPKSFPQTARHPLSPRHTRLWNWFDALTPGVKPRPRVEPWPRGGAKSTSGELGVVWIGHKLTRRLVLYVCETQTQADEHVATIGTLFERLGVGRATNEYGSSKGWKGGKLRTANGFNVVALGLDTAARGIRIDEFRPDLILFDDIDGRYDSLETIKKKKAIITQTILPAGSSDCASLFLQNLIHKHSIVNQLVKGTAGFLSNRETAEVEPAIRDMVVEPYRREDTGLTSYKIVSGTPTWEGQSLATCEAQIDEWGLDAFMREAQQDVDNEEGGLWTRELLHTGRVAEYPTLIQIVVSIDPNATDNGDEAGILVSGKAALLGIEHAFVLEDATVAGGPKKWAEAGVRAYRRWRADMLVAEKNNGGDMVAITISTVPGAPSVELVHASRGKITRAQPVKKLYSDGRVHHVGDFPELETELCTYKPGMPSPNRLDALVWGVTALLLPEAPKREHVPVNPVVHLQSWARRPR